MENGGYDFKTNSGSQYRVLSKPENNSIDLVESVKAGAGGERVAKVREFGEATVVFLEPDLASSLDMYAGALKKGTLKLVVRAIAGDMDSLRVGREPQVTSRAESDKRIDYIKNGGSFRLFVEGGSDFNRVKQDLGNVEFYPQAGSRALIIPKKEGQVPTVTKSVESSQMLSAQARLLSTIFG